MSVVSAYVKTYVKMKKALAPNQYASKIRFCYSAVPAMTIKKASYNSKVVVSFVIAEN